VSRLTGAASTTVCGRDQGRSGVGWVGRGPDASHERSEGAEHDGEGREDDQGRDPDERRDEAEEHPDLRSQNRVCGKWLNVAQRNAFAVTNDHKHSNTPRPGCGGAQSCGVVSVRGGERAPHLGCFLSRMRRNSRKGSGANSLWNKQNDEGG